MAEKQHRHFSNIALKLSTTKYAKEQGIRAAEQYFWLLTAKDTYQTHDNDFDCFVSINMCYNVVKLLISKNVNEKLDVFYIPVHLIDKKKYGNLH